MTATFGFYGPWIITSKATILDIHCHIIMAVERSQNEKSPASASPNPAMASCRKKKNEDATFLEDFKDHIDEFIHASMDEHKTCFQKTIKKMFGMSKVVAERNAENTGVESSLPLQTTVSD